MTALVVVAGTLAVAAIAALAAAWAHDRRRVEHLSYTVQWTESDREAHLLELAVQTVDKGRWHRRAKRLEQENRGLLEQLVSPRRRPIALPAARSPIPDYGPRNR